MSLTCIAGMHRSGTSLVSRMVNLVGVDLGPEEEMIQPGPENPRGFWENSHIKAVNESVLQAMGGSWDEPPILQPGWEASKALDDLRKGAGEVLDRLVNYDNFAWKDPRNSLTLPFWRTVRDIDRVVIVVRDPKEVAASLWERNGFTRKKGERLWLRYIADAIAAAPSHLLIRYEDALAAPEETARRIAEYLEVGPLTESRLSKVGDAVDAALDRADGECMATESRTAADALYEILSTNATGTAVAVCGELSGGIASEQQVQEAAQQVQELQTRFVVREEDNEALRADNEALRADNEALRADSEALWDEKEALRADNEALRADNEALRADNEALWGEKTGLLEENQSLKKSLSASENEANALRMELEITRAELRRKKTAEEYYDRLRSRRSVRLALEVSKAARPVFKVVRKARQGPVDAVRHPDPAKVEEDKGRNKEGGITVPEREGQAGRLNRVVSVGWDDQEAREGHRDGINYTNIVVPVHNAWDDVSRCLESVAEWTNLRLHKLIIVDDGSDSDVEMELRARAQELGATLIRRDSAGGFGVAANAGLEACWLPSVILLNSDTIVGPDWAERLLACAYSDTRVGIVGPWSNAASWQSIPELSDGEGNWSTNPSIDPDDTVRINDRLHAEGVRLYPRVELVNGFCYLIKRRVLEEIGSLDVDRFPKGYGEEDDLSIRASQRGYTKAIADDCFVYHAKSKSYSVERRREISSSSKESLAQKHGKEAIEQRVRATRFGRDLVRARSVASGLLGERGGGPAIPASGPTIGWLEPHLEQVGGIRRAVEMSNRLCQAGWHVSLVTLQSADARESCWTTRAELLDVEKARERWFDILLVSDPDVVGAIEGLSFGELVVYHLDAYFLYRETGLEEYYRISKGVRNIANSGWTAQRVKEWSGVEAAGVVPGGVDTNQFSPRPARMDFDVVCYGSKRARKRTTAVEEAAEGLRLGKLAQLSKGQGDLSWQYSRGEVFVSASSQEGFNLPCLEAMACGVPVVCTDDGGCREYVVHEENALIVEEGSPEGIRREIERLRGNDRLQAKLISGGIETAREMTWDAATRRFVDLIR